jgi:hypothetical protein
MGSTLVYGYVICLQRDSVSRNRVPQVNLDYNLLTNQSLYNDFNLNPVSQGYSLEVKLFSLSMFFFYAPVSKDRGHIVFGQSVCLFVCLTLTLTISFEWQVIGLSYFIYVYLHLLMFYPYVTLLKKNVIQFSMK